LERGRRERTALWNKKEEERKRRIHLTVRLLVTSTSAWTSELFGLTATRISDKKSTVIRDEDVLDLLLGSLINKLLVVGDDGLADGLTDGIELRSVTTTADTDAEIDIGKALLAEKKDRLKDLEAEKLRLDKLNGAAVETDHALALLADGNSNSCALTAKTLHKICLFHYNKKNDRLLQVYLLL